MQEYCQFLIATNDCMNDGLYSPKKWYKLDKRKRNWFGGWKRQTLKLNEKIVHFLENKWILTMFIFLFLTFSFISTNFNFNKQELPLPRAYCPTTEKRKGSIKPGKCSRAGKQSPNPFCWIPKTQWLPQHRNEQALTAECMKETSSERRHRLQ